MLSLFPWLFCDPSFSADPRPNSFFARVFSREPLDPDGPKATPDPFGVPDALESEETLFLDGGAGPLSLPVVMLNDADNA